MHKCTLILTALITTIATAAPTPDVPQESSTQLQEVVVTAQHRAERVQDVPMSIQAFSQENLDKH